VVTGMFFECVNQPLGLVFDRLIRGNEFGVDVGEHSACGPVSHGTVQRTAANKRFVVRFKFVGESREEGMYQASLASDPFDKWF
jgi:hypothetical protein